MPFDITTFPATDPVAAALDLLTVEMPDPIGSQFGIVVDEVTYGADLRDALTAMADRWDMEDIRMFVVSLSVQTETGGNLAEILENLASVVRARASLFLKVRALSSEGRMTGWILTILFRPRTDSSGVGAGRSGGASAAAAVALASAGRLARTPCRS